ncbi:AraC family transcriptional regulator [Pinirhizobacter sp.]|jgi:AraC family transcriptional activator of mtrCDE|uniref:AraC family transcriptional regulator n=1 Tax=Pinirhizobacter sp. TaxID=2950432 RepID=UPI002F3F1FCC
MTQSPSLRVHDVDFDRLMGVLDVNVRSLIRIPMGAGTRVLLPASDTAAVCFCLRGTIELLGGEHSSTALQPGTMVIVPCGKGVIVDSSVPGTVARVLDLSALRSGTLGQSHTSVGQPTDGAGAEVICGYFKASFASTIDVFAGVPSPIIEVFDGVSRVADYLVTAVGELAGQDLGVAAMTTALFKQVLICVFRQCLKSPGQMSEHVLLFRDPQIARAFGEMAARPGARHTVTSLAALASLSRSAFMARFSQTVGRTPMATLRDLRMRRAETLLAAETSVLEQIAHAVGYGSRSGFVRAFRQTYGRDPWPGRG